MRSTLATALLLIGLGGLAHAGTLTISIQTAAGTQSASVTAADADLDRVLAAQKALATARLKPGEAAPTDDAVKQKWADEVVKGIFGNTVQIEKAQAARAAILAIPPLNPTLKP